MSKYRAMDDEEKALANAAANAITKVAVNHKPMAAFEAFCTLAALYAAELKLPAESATARIEDRHRLMVAILQGRSSASN